MSTKIVHCGEEAIRQPFDIAADLAPLFACANAEQTIGRSC